MLPNTEIAAARWDPPHRTTLAPELFLLSLFFPPSAPLVPPLHLVK